MDPISEPLKSEYPDMNNICRLCLKQNAGVINIYDTNPDGLSISIRIMTCAALEVQESDGLPSFICLPCRLILEKSYLLRKMAQSSDSKLRRHLRLLSAGKKSRVFEEEDDMELEFEDSIKFIKSQEEIIKQQEQEELAKEIYESMEADRIQKEKDLKEQFDAQQNLNREKWTSEMEKKLRSESEALQAQFREKYIAEEQLKRAKWKASALKDLKRSNKLNQAALEERLRKEIAAEENDRMLEEFKLFLTYRKFDKFNCTTCLSKSTTTTNEHRTSKKEQNSGDMESEMHSAEEDTKQDCEYDEMNEADGENESTVYVFSKDVSEEIHESQASSCSDFVITTVDEENNSTDDIIEADEFGLLKGHVDQEDTEELTYVDIDDVLPSIATEAQSDHTSTIIENENNLGQEDYKFINSHQTEITMATSFSQSTDIVRSFKCLKCPQSFTKEAALVRHSSVHTKKNKYCCSFCDKHFACSSSLNRHIRIHTGEKPFVCQECGKSFMQNEVLKRHAATHTNDKPFSCEFCGKAFVQRQVYAQHVKLKHMEIDQTASNQCHLCSKKFNHASGLSRHLLTHSGVSYTCLKCGRKFNDKSALRRHVMTMHKTDG